MFRKESQLGEGAYGIVYKVKSLKTTVVSNENNKRVLMTNSSNSTVIKRKLNQGDSKVRSLIQDQIYVIKVIDTRNVEKDGALEAMMEIEIMSELDNPYIVSYLDSFIIDSQINIVMEYC